MKKLNIYFYLFLFISSINTSNIKADVYLENFSLVDVLKKLVQKQEIAIKKLSKKSKIKKAKKS